MLGNSTKVWFVPDIEVKGDLAGLPWFLRRCIDEDPGVYPVFKLDDLLLFIMRLSTLWSKY